jgi:hypothetical protein
MRSGKWAAYAAAIAVVAVAGASSAEAQVVRFSSKRDAVPATFFDAAASHPSSTNANKLIIGLDAGSDPTTLLARSFTASTLPFYNRSAMDTISFKITAPLGYYVAAIVYTQQGSGFTGRSAVEGGAATWVVAGYPSSLGVFTSNPNLTRTADLTALKLTTVPVSITVSLFASATGGISVTSANVIVKLLPLP